MIKQVNQNNGFVIVASSKYVFYKSAILCAESLRDFYPDAHITFFTHKEWVDNDCNVFDDIKTDIPNNKRAKMWALARSPYNLTMYLDADIEVRDSEISNCFHLIPENFDILMTKIRPYAAAITEFPGGMLTWHCGLFLFRKNQKMINFFQDWYNDYYQQQKDWTFDTDLYPKTLQPWDTWTFWKLLHLDGYDEKIRIGRFPEDARWNFHNLRYNELEGKSIILYHNTIRKRKTHERDRD